jgi:hypothetical protein
MTQTNTLAQRLFDIAFTRVRSERSQVYKDGVMAALQTMCEPSKAGQSCPYTAGTVEFDAWFAGKDEGMGIYRDHFRNSTAQRGREDSQALLRRMNKGAA